jgi:hypothetical protein
VSQLYAHYAKLSDDGHHALPSHLNVQMPIVNTE